MFFRFNLNIYLSDVVEGLLLFLLKNFLWIFFLYSHENLFVYKSNKVFVGESKVEIFLWIFDYVGY